MVDSLEPADELKIVKALGPDVKSLVEDKFIRQHILELSDLGDESQIERFSRFLLNLRVSRVRFRKALMLAEKNGDQPSIVTKAFGRALLAAAKEKGFPEVDQTPGIELIQE